MKINTSNYWASLETSLIDTINNLNGLQYYFQQLNLVKDKGYEWELTMGKAHKYFIKAFKFAERMARRYHMEPREIEALYEQHTKDLTELEDYIAQYLSEIELDEKIDTDCVKSKSVEYALSTVRFSSKMLQEMLNKGHRYENYGTEKTKVIEAFVEMTLRLRVEAHQQRNGEWQEVNTNNARTTVYKRVGDLIKASDLFDEC